MDPATSRELLSLERGRLEDLKRALTERSFRPAPGPWMPASDQHPAATETFERERDRSIVGRIDAQIDAVAEATRRLEHGRYGNCEACGVPIPDDRLEALPAARYCIDDRVRLERSTAHSRLEPLAAERP